MAAVQRTTDVARQHIKNARWIPSAQWHITLKFLGNVLVEDIQKIGDVLSDCTTQPCDIELVGLGAFPNPIEAKVLWVGVKDPLGTLSVLHKNIEHGLGSIGFPADGRVFQPHVTLARTKTTLSGVNNTISTISKLEGHRTRCNKLTLFSSVLNPSGPIYKVLRTIPLKKI